MVLGLVFQDNLGSDLEKQMSQQAHNDVSYTPDANGITEAWNSLQDEVLLKFESLENTAVNTR